MPSGIVAICGLICGMISLRFIMAIEKAQVTVVGAIGQSIQADRIVAMAMGSHKLFVMKMAIALFSKLSNLMFSLEGMYHEKAVQKAISSMMNTVVASTKARVVVSRDMIRNVRQKLVISNALENAGSNNHQGFP